MTSEGCGLESVAGWVDCSSGVQCAMLPGCRSRAAVCSGMCSQLTDSFAQGWCNYGYVVGCPPTEQVGVTPVDALYYYLYFYLLLAE